MESIGRHSLSAIPAASAKKSSSAAADRCPLQFFHFLAARLGEARRGEARRGARRERAEGDGRRGAHGSSRIDARDR